MHGIIFIRIFFFLRSGVVVVAFCERRFRSIVSGRQDASAKMKM
jgi:hypothetical protein